MDVTSPTTPVTPLSAAAALLRRLPLARLFVPLGAVAVLVSMLALTWQRSPAVPAAGTPAMSFGFGELGDLLRAAPVPTTTLQDAYFGWLAWALCLATVTVAVGYAVTPRLGWGVATVLVSLGGLVVTVLAFKGAMTWSQMWDARSLMSEQLGAGSVIALSGYALAAVGVALPSRRR